MNVTLAAQQPWSKRPRFAPRQLLDADRLNAALEDELERQRLLNLALHGWGVVFGFGVRLPASDHSRTRTGCCLVTCGLALDTFGRMLHTQDRLLSLEDLEGSVPTKAGEYTLLVHHAERLDPSCRDACSGTGPQWREYGVVFTLQPDCEPVQDDCPDLAGQCLSRTAYIRRRIGSAEGSPGRSPDLEHICARPGPLRPTRSGSWCYDPTAGVPIACLTIGDRNDPGGKQGTGDARCLVIDGVCADDCSPVRHVYRSPLLRELLSCCDVDLPRVERVSWQTWVRPGGRVAWDEFSARIQVVDEAAADGDGFVVWFSRPVKTKTLTTASVLLSAVTQEELADYWMAGRVPIEVRPLQAKDGLASGVRLVANAEWLQAEVTGKRSSLADSDDGFRLEITIRGQLLRDECDHMLNALPPDLGCAPCQGRPGDDLIWAFDIGARGARNGFEDGRARDELPAEEETT